MAAEKTKAEELKMELEAVKTQPDPPKVLILMGEMLLESLESEAPTGAKHGFCEDPECESCTQTQASIVSAAQQTVFVQLDQVLAGMNMPDDIKDVMIHRYNAIANPDQAGDVTLGQDDPATVWVKMGDQVAPIIVR